MSDFEYQNVTTTEVPTKTNVNELIYLIAPIVIIVVIILFSALVYLMARKRRIDKLRVNLLALYDFDSNEQEWESLNIYDNRQYLCKVIDQSEKCAFVSRGVISVQDGRRSCVNFTSIFKTNKSSKMESERRKCYINRSCDDSFRF